MAVTKTIDMTDFLKKSQQLIDNVVGSRITAAFEVGGEILRLSSFEVPHDLGLLQNSGTVEQQGDNVVVGYNKVYAARLHENPGYRFQKGRKAKYLEDPIKMNLNLLLNHLGKVIKGSMEGGGSNGSAAPSSSNKVSTPKPSVSSPTFKASRAENARAAGLRQVNIANMNNFLKSKGSPMRVN